MEFIVGRKGNQPFPITDQSVSGKHLKLTTLPDGRVEVEDIGSTNGTFIDGVRIIKKVVDAETVVQLGSSYKLKISDVIKTAEQKPEIKQTPQPQGGTMPKPQQPQVKEYSISHLEGVWKRYDEALKALNDKNRSIALMGRVSPIFTLGSGAIAGIAKGNDWGNGVFMITTILTLIGLVVMIYSIFQTKSFDFTREKEKLDDQLIKDYVCPNPDCKHFLGFQRYSILKQNKNCPYCRCKHLSKNCQGFSGLQGLII